MFQKRRDCRADGLIDAIVAGFKCNGFLPGTRYIARTERLPEEALAVDVSVVPKRAIAFGSVKAFV
jgi:hypothetical protein